MIKSPFMYELPLFPLNSVLFPGTPLQLHIFEQRYKLMIGKCLEERSPFGVVLIRQGMEARGALAEPHTIGCTAQIINVQRLNDGRMNIVTVGQGRFRIHHIDNETNTYLVGKVEDLPLRNPRPEITGRMADELRLLVVRFIQALVRAGNAEFDIQQIPQDSIKLAYMAAAFLQSSPTEKQHILGIDQAENLLSALLSDYRRENAFLKTLLAERSTLQNGGFSRN